MELISDSPPQVGKNLHLLPVFILFSPGINLEEDQDKTPGDELT